MIIKGKSLVDIFTEEKRSEIMSLIKGKNTKPELQVRKYLFSKGFRFRVHYNKLPGHPDIVLPKYKTVIFVHGCFWHQHPGCKHSRIPETRREFWEQKFMRNKERDQKKIDMLEELGWKVFVVWECEIKKHDMSIVDKIIDDMSNSYK